MGSCDHKNDLYLFNESAFSHPSFPRTPFNHLYQFSVAMDLSHYIAFKLKFIENLRLGECSSSNCPD